MNKNRTFKKMNIQFFAGSNLKGLIEQRAELEVQLEAILGTAKVEERAISEDEKVKFDEIDKKIKDIDNTIAAEERAEAIKKGAKKAPADETAEDIEERAFANYIRKEAGLAVELRAGEQNVTMGNNGALIPTSIANRIIKAIKDICPILAKATIYNVKGTLKVPVWGKANSTHDIAVGYQTEFTDITADAGKFTSVDLGGYLAGALTLIGKSVANNAAMDVVSFIVTQMAEEIAIFIEGQLLNGTGSSAATGILNTTNTMNSGSVSVITAENLIALQAKVKQAYQGSACWTMHPDTFTAIKQLKDLDGRFLFQDDITSEIPYRLLGKPVYLSDNMPKITSASKAVLYGDYSGLSVNFRENIEIQVLTEKYATMHALGVVAWFEFDSKVTDNQKVAALVMSV